MLFSLTLLSRRIPENRGGPMLCDGLFASRTRHLHCLLLAAIVTQQLLTASLLAESHMRPNILFVMTDDQGYWDTGATENPHIDTPNIDRIAADGVQLDRYYAAMVCAPTRAGFMTGRHYLRTKLYNTRFGGDSLGLEEVTIAQRLQQAGCRTGLFGNSTPLRWAR